MFVKCPHGRNMSEPNSNQTYLALWKKRCEDVIFGVIDFRQVDRLSLERVNNDSYTPVIFPW